MIKILFAGFATIDIIRGKKFLGGAAAAMSVNATQLEVESHLLTALSDSADGKKYQQVLNKYHVHTDWATHSSPMLPTCVITDVYGKGSTRQWKDNGALAHLPQSVPNEINTFDAIFFCNAEPDWATHIALYLNRRIGCYIPGPQCVNNPSYVRAEILQKTAVLFCNDEEAPFIQQHKPFDHGVSLLAITKGKQGGAVYSPSEKVHSFTATVATSVVDTTGAGDAFALGFAYEYISKHNIPAAIQQGQALASRVLASQGGLLIM